jgi:ribosome-associated protein
LSPVRVGRSVVIPDDELRFRFSPSGGPGGQHANRSSTRAELVWNVAGSRALGPRQRQRVERSLASRIDSAGNIRLSSDVHRSQLRNREEVERRLARLLADALRHRRARIPTAPSETSSRRRVEEKRRRSEKKRLRRAPPPDP